MLAALRSGRGSRRTPRQVIVLPAGPDLDPRNSNATILDLDTWKPIGNPAVGIDAYQAFTLPDSTKTYIVAKGAEKTVTVIGDLSTGGQVLKVIDLPQGSTDAALTPDGKRLLLVSMTDAALTIFNTSTDRVMARIPLATPANSVAVNFESTRAFVALPAEGSVTAIDLGTNAVDKRIALGKEVKAMSQLAFAPNGLLYVAVNDLLHEIDPGNMQLIAATVPAKGVTGRPWFTFEGVQTLLLQSQPSGLTLAGVRSYRSPTADYAQPGVSIDRLRIVSESQAIGYSPADRTFYRIDLKPTLEVTPIPGLADLGRNPVAGFGGTHEYPKNRFLFVSSGKSIYKLDAETNLIVGSQTIGQLAGLPILPSVPSQREPASLYMIGEAVQSFPAGTTSLPVVMRSLDEAGLPVRGQSVRFNVYIGAYWGEGVERGPVSNSDGYVQSRYEVFGRTGVYIAWADEQFAPTRPIRSFTLNTRPSPPPLNRFIVYRGDGQTPRPMLLRARCKFALR
ncbi:MAG: hypothetical protein K2X03_25920 [Bryobacteraceae bacterium]|nr:hypothetical protein [Bryobacteraceae bacterium]